MNGPSNLPRPSSYPLRVQGGSWYIRLQGPILEDQMVLAVSKVRWPTGGGARSSWFGTAPVQNPESANVMSPSLAAEFG